MTTKIRNTQRFNFSINKSLAILLAGIMFVEIVAIPLAEANQYEGMWQERRKQIQKSNEQTSRQQLASLPDSFSHSLIHPTQILEQLPASRSNQLGLPGGSWQKDRFVEFSQPLQNLLRAVPLSHANVKEIHDAPTPSAPPVVLVQDIHLNPEAQSNIAKVLAALIDEKRVSTIGVEGAFGDFDFSSFHAFDQKKIVEEVSHDFLENGLISAPSYVGINQPLTSARFVGVDDPEGYAANVKAYLATRPAVSGVEKNLNKETTLLAKEKNEIFSPELKKFDALRTGYDQGKVGLGLYGKGLIKMGGEAGFELERFLLAHDMESHLNFARVEQERKTVIEKLVGRLSEKEVNNLLQQSLAYRLGQMSYGDYYRQMRETCKKNGLDLSQTPTFDEYIRYVLLSDGISAEKLFKEVEELETSLLKQMVLTAEQERLVKQGEWLMLAGKLVKFELTPEEWTKYLSHRRPGMSFGRGPGSNPRENLDPGQRIAGATNLKAFESFYEQADLRSHKMIENLQKGSPSAAVLVAGGFHTELLTQILKEKHVPYVVVSPKITKISDEAGSAYLTVFAREKTPLEKLFSGEKLFVSPNNIHAGSQGGFAKPVMVALLAVMSASIVALSMVLKNNLGITVVADLVHNGFYQVNLARKGEIPLTLYVGLASVIGIKSAVATEFKTPKVLVWFKNPFPSFVGKVKELSFSLRNSLVENWRIVVSIPVWGVLSYYVLPFMGNSLGQWASILSESGSGWWLQAAVLGGLGQYLFITANIVMFLTFVTVSVYLFSQTKLGKFLFNPLISFHKKYEKHWFLHHVFDLAFMFYGFGFKPIVNLLQIAEGKETSDPNILERYFGRGPPSLVKMMLLPFVAAVSIVAARMKLMVYSYLVKIMLLSILVSFFGTDGTSIFMHFNLLDLVLGHGGSLSFSQMGGMTGAAVQFFSIFGILSSYGLQLIMSYFSRAKELRRVEYKNINIVARWPLSLLMALRDVFWRISVRNSEGVIVKYRWPLIVSSLSFIKFGGLHWVSLEIEFLKWLSLGFAPLHAVVMTVEDNEKGVMGAAHQMENAILPHLGVDPEMAIHGFFGLNTPGQQMSSLPPAAIVQKERTQDNLDAEENPQTVTTVGADVAASAVGGDDNKGAFSKFAYSVARALAPASFFAVENLPDALLSQTLMLATMAQVESKEVKEKSAQSEFEKVLAQEKFTEKLSQMEKETLELMNKNQTDQKLKDRLLKAGKMVIREIGKPNDTPRLFNLPDKFDPNDFVWKDGQLMFYGKSFLKVLDDKNPLSPVKYNFSEPVPVILGLDSLRILKELNLEKIKQEKEVAPVKESPKTLVFQQAPKIKLEEWVKSSATLPDGSRVSNVGDLALKNIVFVYDMAIDAQRLLAMGRIDEAKKLLLTISGPERWRQSKGGRIDSFNVKTGQPLDYANGEVRVSNGPNMHLALSALTVWAVDGGKEAKLFKTASDVGEFILKQQKEDGGIPFGPEPQAFGDGVSFQKIFNPEYQIDAYALFHRMAEVTGDSKWAKAADKALYFLIERHYDSSRKKFWAKNAHGVRDYPQDVPGWAISMIGVEKLAAKRVDIDALAADLGEIPEFFVTEWLVNRANGLNKIIAHYKTKGFSAKAQVAQDNLKKIDALLAVLPVQPSKSGGGLSYAYQKSEGSWITAEGRDTNWGFPAQRGSSLVAADAVALRLRGHDPVSGEFIGVPIVWRNFRRAIKQMDSKKPIALNSPVDEKEQPVEKTNTSKARSETLNFIENQTRKGLVLFKDNKARSDALKKEGLFKVKLKDPKAATEATPESLLFVLPKFQKSDFTLNPNGQVLFNGDYWASVKLEERAELKKKYSLYDWENPAPALLGLESVDTLRKAQKEKESNPKPSIQPGEKNRQSDQSKDNEKIRIAEKNNFAAQNSLLAGFLLADNRLHIMAKRGESFVKFMDEDALKAVIPNDKLREDFKSGRFNVYMVTTDPKTGTIQKIYANERIPSDKKWDRQTNSATNETYSASFVEIDPRTGQLTYDSHPASGNGSDVLPTVVVKVKYDPKEYWSYGEMFSVRGTERVNGEVFAWMDLGSTGNRMVLETRVWIPNTDLNSSDIVMMSTDVNPLLYLAGGVVDAFSWGVNAMHRTQLRDGVIGDVTNGEFVKTIISRIVPKDVMSFLAAAESLQTIDTSTDLGKELFEQAKKAWDIYDLIIKKELGPEHPARKAIREYISLLKSAQPGFDIKDFKERLNGLPEITANISGLMATPRMYKPIGQNLIAEAINPKIKKGYQYDSKTIGLSAEQRSPGYFLDIIGRVGVAHPSTKDVQEYAEYLGKFGFAPDEDVLRKKSKEQIANINKATRLFAEQNSGSNLQSTVPSQSGSSSVVDLLSPGLRQQLSIGQWQTIVGLDRMLGLSNNSSGAPQSGASPDLAQYRADLMRQLPRADYGIQRSPIQQSLSIDGARNLGMQQLRANGGSAGAASSGYSMFGGKTGYGEGHPSNAIFNHWMEQFFAKEPNLKKGVLDSFSALGLGPNHPTVKSQVRSRLRNSEGLGANHPSVAIQNIFQHSMLYYSSQDMMLTQLRILEGVDGYGPDHPTVKFWTRIAKEYGKQKQDFRKVIVDLDKLGRNNPMWKSLYEGSLSQWGVNHPVVENASKGPLYGKGAGHPAVIVMEVVKQFIRDGSKIFDRLKTSYGEQTSSPKEFESDPVMVRGLDIYNESLKVRYQEIQKYLSEGKIQQAKEAIREYKEMSNKMSVLDPSEAGARKVDIVSGALKAEQDLEKAKKEAGPVVDPKPAKEGSSSNSAPKDSPKLQRFIQVGTPETAQVRAARQEKFLVRLFEPVKETFPSRAAQAKIYRTVFEDELSNSWVAVVNRETGGFHHFEIFNFAGKKIAHLDGQITINGQPVRGDIRSMRTNDAVHVGGYREAQLDDEGEHLGEKLFVVGADPALGANEFVYETLKKIKTRDPVEVSTDLPVDPAKANSSTPAPVDLVQVVEKDGERYLAKYSIPTEEFPDTVLLEKRFEDGRVEIHSQHVFSPTAAEWISGRVEISLGAGFKEIRTIINTNDGNPKLDDKNRYSYTVVKTYSDKGDYSREKVIQRFVETYEKEQLYSRFNEAKQETMYFDTERQRLVKHKTNQKVELPTRTEVMRNGEFQILAYHSVVFDSLEDNKLSQMTVSTVYPGQSYSLENYGGGLPLSVEALMRKHGLVNKLNGDRFYWEIKRSSLKSSTRNPWGLSEKIRIDEREDARGLEVYSYQAEETKGNVSEGNEVERVYFAKLASGNFKFENGSEGEGRAIPFTAGALRVPRGKVIEVRGTKVREMEGPLAGAVWSLRGRPEGSIDQSSGLLRINQESRSGEKSNIYSDVEGRPLRIESHQGRLITNQSVYWDTFTWKTEKSQTIRDGVLEKEEEKVGSPDAQGKTRYEVREFIRHRESPFRYALSWLRNISPSLITPDHSSILVRGWDSKLERREDPLTNIATEYDSDLSRELDVYGMENLPIPLKAMDLKSGEPLATYSTTPKIGKNNLVKNLVIQRSSLLDNNFIEKETYERAPEDAVDSFGRFQGVLRLRNREEGRGKTKIEERVYYSDDMNWEFLMDFPVDSIRTSLLRMVGVNESEVRALIDFKSQLRDSYESRGAHELGRTLSNIENPSQKEEIVRFINAGVDYSKGTQPLLHLIQAWPGALLSHHWIDSTGREVSQRLEQVRTSIVENQFDRVRFHWENSLSKMTEAPPKNFIPLKNSDGSVDPVVQVNQVRSKVAKHDFFPDSSKGETLTEIVERPSSSVGDPENGKVISYLDELGRLQAQANTSHGQEQVDGLTYYPQFEETGMRRIFNGRAIPKKWSEAETPEGADFIFFFVRGKNADGVQLKVKDGKGKEATLQFNPRDPNNSGLWHSEFSNPVITRNESGDRFRQVNVRPMKGKIPYMAVGNNARGVSLSVAQLSALGLDVASLNVYLEEEGFEVSPLVRLGRGQNNQKWKSEKSTQAQFFPLGEMRKGISDRDPEIIDNKNGVVIVIRGVGTESQTLVYDHGVLASMTYWLRNGESYDEIRVGYSPSMLDSLHIPSQVSAAFSGWLSRIPVTKQYPLGRLQSNIANVDKGLSITILPSRSGKNFNRPASNYVPFGQSDMNAKYMMMNANLVNSFLRYNFPNLEPTYQDFLDEPPTQIPAEVKKVMDPFEIKKLIESMTLDLPFFWRERKGPELNTDRISLPDSLNSRSWSKFVRDLIDKNKVTHLPATHPGTHREKFADTVQLAEILRGLVRESPASPESLEYAKKMAEFVRLASGKGNFPMLSGYMTDRGAQLQLSYEWWLPGQATPTASANVNMALAMLELARVTGDQRDWEVALGLLQQSMRFMPDNDYFYSLEKSPKIRADELLGSWDRFLRSKGKSAGITLTSEQKRGVLAAHQLYSTPISNPDQMTPNEWLAARQRSIEIIIEGAQSQINKEPQQSQKNRQIFSDALSLILTTNAAEQEALRYFLSVYGGFSEYLPRRPILFHQLGIHLSPEPDNYEPKTNRDALEMLKAFGKAMEKQPVPELDNLLQKIEINEARLSLWWEQNILPVVGKEGGGAPAHWREQRWITGVDVEQNEGTSQGYVFVAGRWVTLESSIATIEAFLMIDSSEASKGKAKEWLINIYKIFKGERVSENGEVSVGLDYAPETFGRPGGYMFSSELTARFGRLSEVVGLQEGVNFAKKSLQSVVLNNGLVQEAGGYSPKKPDVLKGVPTGDGRVVGFQSNGQFGPSPVATLLANEFVMKIPLGSNIQSVEPNSPSSVAIGSIANRIRDGDWVSKTKDLVGQPNFQISAGVMIGVSVLAWLAARLLHHYKNKNSIVLRIIRDIFFIPILLSPVLLYVYLASVGVLPISGFWIVLMAVWLFPSTQLIYSEFTSLLFHLYKPVLGAWKNISENKKILPKDFKSAFLKRYYKNMGLYDIPYQGTPTDYKGLSVPSEFENKGHIGTGEMLFLKGLEDISAYTIRFFQIKNSSNPEWKEWAEKRGLDTNDPEWIYRLLSGEFMPSSLNMETSQGWYRNSIENEKDVDELFKVGQFQRKIGEWFRNQLALKEDKFSSHIYARTSIFLDDKAEQLRQILSKPLIEGRIDSLSQLPILNDGEIAAFMEVLDELQITSPDSLAQEDIANMVKSHASRFNLRSIHPLWFEIFSFSPRLILFFLTFVFAYTRETLSPLHLISGNFYMLSPASQGVGLVLSVLGLVGLFISVSIFGWGYYRVDNQRMDMQVRSEFQRWGARPIALLLMFAGMVGVTMLAPGFMSVWFDGGSMEVAGMILPLLAIGILGFEMLALITNNISFVRTTWRYQWRPAAVVGSPQAVVMYFFQYLLFMAFVFVGLEVVPFFEGYWVSLWNYNFVSEMSLWTIISPIILWGLVWWGGDQVWKLRASYLYEKPSKEKRGMVYFLTVISALVIILSVAWYRPLGGIAVGGLVFVVSATLAHTAIGSLMVGITSVYRSISKPRVLVELFLSTLAIGWFTGDLGRILVPITQWGVTGIDPLQLLPNLMVLSPAGIVASLLFTALLVIFLIAVGHPAFSAPSLAVFTAGYLLPFDPLTGYWFKMLFLILLGLGVLARLVRGVIRHDFEKQADKINLADIDDKSFGVWDTGGQFNASPALQMGGIETAVGRYMELYDKVLVSNGVPMLRWMQDSNGAPLTREKIEEALRALFKAEFERKTSLWGEDCIVVGSLDDSNLSETQKILKHNKINYEDTEGNQRILNHNFLFPVNSLEEAEKLKLGKRLEVGFNVLDGGNFQRDTAYFMIQYGRSLKAAGLNDKAVFYIQENAYSGKKERTDKGDPNPRDVMDPQFSNRLVESLERLAMARYIYLTTGVATEVVRNSSATGMKSACQNGNTGSFHNLKYVDVFDRNAWRPSSKRNMANIVRMIGNPDIAVIFPRRTTSNTIWPIGGAGRLGEGGFSQYESALIGDLGGWKGEMIAIGWSTMLKILVKDVDDAYSDPNYPDRTSSKSFLGRIFGGTRTRFNFPHQSEDYIQSMMLAESIKALGGEPEIALSEDTSFKMREIKHLFEMLTARTRWAGGGDVGQVGRDILVQNIAEFGTNSIFMKDMKRNRARYYILGPIGLLNVLLTPILVMSGYTPFAGILLVFWALGFVANQVLTLNGLALYIEDYGFWAGSALWISERFRDPLLFAGLTFIEVYGVLDSWIKGPHYSFAFGISGAVKILQFYNNPWEIILTSPGATNAFRWLFYMGFISTLSNLYIISRLDLLNPIMLYPSLVFSAGLMIGWYLYDAQNRPYREKWGIFPKVFSPAINIFQVYWPKLVGLFLGLVTLGLISVGTSELMIPIGINAALLVVASFFFLLKAVPNLSLKKGAANTWGAVFVIAAGIIVYNSFTLPALIAAVPLIVGMGMLWMFFPGKMFLVPVGYNPIENKSLVLPENANETQIASHKLNLKNQLLHNRWIVLGTWVFIALANVILFSVSTQSPIGLLTGLIPLWKIYEIWTHDWTRAPGVNLNVPVITKKYQEDMTDEEKKNFDQIYAIQERQRKDQQTFKVYVSETIRRTAILTFIAFIWFVIVPSPALASARILAYNLTVNYQQISQGLGFMGLTVGIFMVFGLSTYLIYTYKNYFLYNRLMKRHRFLVGGLNKEEKDTYTHLTGEFELLHQGILAYINQAAPLKVASYIKEANQILNAIENRNPQGFFPVFGGRSPKSDDQGPTKPTSFLRPVITRLALTLNSMAMVLKLAFMSVVLVFSVPLSGSAEEGKPSNPNFKSQYFAVESAIDLNRSLKVVGSPERYEEKVVASAVLELTKSVPLGLREFNTTLNPDITTDTKSLKKYLKDNRVSLIQGRYLNEYANSAPVRLKEGIVPSKGFEGTLKVIFTPKGTTFEEIERELKQLSKNLPRNASKIKIELRLSQTLALTRAQRNDLKSRGVINISSWDLPASISEATDQLLAVGTLRASRLLVLFAQGSEIPYQAQAVFEQLETDMSGGFTMGMLLANMIMAVPLKAAEMPDMKKYELIASQA